MSTCGIDFGTSNSMVALATEDGVIDLEIDRGHSPPQTMPTVMFCTPDDDWSFGTQAIDKYVSNMTEGRFIQSVKRHLPSKGFTTTWLGGKRRGLPEIVGIFLKNLRSEAKRKYDVDLQSVLLGRPARFHKTAELDAFAEQRLAEAARLAGFKAIAFRREPIAAARAFEETLNEDLLCLVGDLGGGTTDFSVMRLGPSRVGRSDRSGDVLGTAGLDVAGNDFDAALVRLAILPHLGFGTTYSPLGRPTLLPTFLHLAVTSWHQLSLASTPENMRLLQSWIRTASDPAGLKRLLSLMEENLGFALFRSVELCKRNLSDAHRANLRFCGGGVTIDETVDREDFDRETKPLVAAIEDSMVGLLRDLELRDQDIDAVFLTGGTSLIPSVRAMFRRHFDQRLLPGNAFTSVGHGLGVEAMEREWP